MAFNIPDVLGTGVIFTLVSYTKLRDSIIANAHATFQLGGSREMSVSAGGGARDAVSYIEFEVPTSASGGHVYKVVVEVKTENAGTTITPSLYNITDSATTWTGSAGSSTSWAQQVSGSLTVAAGKKYRLRFTKSNDTYEAFGIGYIRRTAS